jgi:integrase
MNQSVKLTKRVVDAVAVPAAGQTFVRDTELKGFALRVTAADVRAFVVEKRIEGKVRRITLGRYGELTVEQARRAAQALLGQVAMGQNPIGEKERERLRAITLAHAFADFKRVRGKLKARTLYDYERLMAVALADWQTRPLVAITKDLVAKRHRELGESRGEAYANLAMRFLRSLLNFALARYEDGFGSPLLAENAVRRLTQTRAWFHTSRRQTVIKPHELPAWYQAVGALRSESSPFAHTVADYLVTLLLTGLRRGEAARLTWDRVDLKDASLRIVDTKNREPHFLPIAPFLAELLARRARGARSAYVFPGEGRAGFLVEPKRYVAKVIELSRVAFTLHDLRRTFITVAESIGVPPYALKRLVNHRVRSDVTEGYIVSDLERLREPMRQIERFLLRATGIAPSAQVIALHTEPPAAQRPLIGG